MINVHRRNFTSVTASNDVNSMTVTMTCHPAMCSWGIINERLDIQVTSLTKCGQSCPLGFLAVCFTFLLLGNFNVDSGTFTDQQAIGHHSYKLLWKKSISAHNIHCCWDCLWKLYCCVTPCTVLGNRQACSIMVFVFFIVALKPHENTLSLLALFVFFYVFFFCIGTCPHGNDQLPMPFFLFFLFLTGDCLFSPKNG